MNLEHGDLVRATGSVEYSGLVMSRNSGGSYKYHRSANGGYNVRVYAVENPTSGEVKFFREDFLERIPDVS